MKKITLKYYGYRDADSQLMQAANLLSAKMRTRTLNVSRRNKSATLYVADPYLAAAYADAIRKKTGCSVVVANLPETVTAFFKFLKERNLLEEWCERTATCWNETITSFTRSTSHIDWISSAFSWIGKNGTADPQKWCDVYTGWRRYIIYNNL